VKTTTIRALRALIFLSALIVIAALVMGCSDKKYEAATLDIDGIDGTTPRNRFELLCDEDMDVAYIKMIHNRGGLTVRLDSTGAPVRCSEIRRWRRRR
jgi:hypothetical protein